ncbi:MAG: murein hydrolase activator EnvC family protein, partial [Actinomycetota bacterium]
MVGGLVLALLLPVASEADQGTDESLQRTRQELSAIRKRLAEARGQAAEIQAQLSSLGAQIDELGRQIEQDQREIAKLEPKIQAAEAELVELESRHQKARQSANERARRIYRAGPAEGLSDLLSAQSIGEFARLSILWRVAAQLDGQTMLETNRLKRELTERREALNRTRSDLNARRASLEQRQEFLSSARAQRSAVLAEMRTKIAEDEEDVKALERQARELTARLRKSPRLSRSTGGISQAGFMWPLSGQVTSGYGRRWGRFHYGIDIDGETGDPLRASKAGVVTDIACGSGYGICSIVDHGDGVATLYAHMSRKTVGRGRVSQGDVIGLVGSTGRSTGSHLHFEVRVNGEPRNPRS